MKIFVFKMKHITAAAFIVMLAVIYFSCGRTLSVFNAQKREIPIYSVERGDNKIALTFDCAWDGDDIDSILETLDEYNVKASFFVTGKWAEDYPENIRKIHERGHDIGNHSYNHADYTKLGSAEIIKDLEKCDAAVENITGEKMTLMRAPSGGYNNNVIQTVRESGRTYIQWSVDGLDYTKDATEASIKKRLSKTKAGDIILMHSGTKMTAKILPSIIRELSEKYELVKVSDLIYSDNFTIDASGCQKQNAGKVN